MTTEAAIIRQLDRRYDKTVMNGSPKFARAAHIPVGLASQRHRICDYIAADMHSDSGPYVPGRGNEWWINPPIFHGHEIKVSRRDWLKELSDPDKAEAFRPYMHYWWLVVPDKSIVRDDLPEGWGLMIANGSTRAVVKPAPNQNPEPMPTSMTGALLRATVIAGNRIYREELAA